MPGWLLHRTARLIREHPDSLEKAVLNGVFNFEHCFSQYERVRVLLWCRCCFFSMSVPNFASLVQVSAISIMTVSHNRERACLIFTQFLPVDCPYPSVTQSLPVVCPYSSVTQSLPVECPYPSVTQSLPVVCPYPSFTLSLPVECPYPSYTQIPQ